LKTLGLYIGITFFILSIFVSGAIGTYFWGDYFLLAQRVGPNDFRVFWEVEDLKSISAERAMLQELLEYADKNAEWKTIGAVCIQDPISCGGEELYETKFASRKITVRVSYFPDGVAYGHRCVWCPVALSEMILLPQKGSKGEVLSGQVHSYALAIITQSGFKMIVHSEFAETDMASRRAYVIADMYKPLIKKIFQKARSSARDFHI